ncbi:MAG: hypothetical protein CSB49_02130 [Proteobacteria bacterium]|nr:MAG: hypothetical protein CSB49_02130 [Pseudomonadota bacterium]
MDTRPALGKLRRPKLPRVEQATLKNGIPVYLLRKHDLPLLQLRVQLRAGLAEDPPRRPGTAYLTAALLDEGAGRRGTLALAAALDELGARLQTGCSYGNSRVTLRLLSRHLRRGVSLLADVVRRPRFAPKDVRRVRGQLAAWSRQRRADGLALADIALSASVHQGYVYGRPRLPTPAELRPLRRADLQRFHRRYYRAERATILVTGDVRMRRLLPLLERAFGRWTPRGPRVEARRPAVLRPAPVKTKRRPLVLVPVPGATQSVLRVGELAPGRRSSDVPALRLLALVLGGSFTSRLNQNLREKHGFTYGARAGFVLRQRRGLLRISTSVAATQTRRSLEQILAEVERLRREPVSAAELAKAQRLLVEERGARSQTVGGLMSIADNLARFSLSPASESRLIDAVLRLDAKTLRATALRYLHPKRLTLVVAGAIKRLRKELERRFGPAYVSGPDGL